MTRINVGVDPKELTDRHLMAEHREIKRIPNVIKSGRFSMNNQPSQFTLGTGHVKFFYDKILYLKNRYISIHKECIKRGFNVTDFTSAFDDVPVKYMNDYSPTQRDRDIILERIRQRLEGK
jgi:hypothetical protein